MTRKRLALAGAVTTVAAGLVAAAAFGAFSSGGRLAASGPGADRMQVHGHWTISC